MEKFIPGLGIPVQIVTSVNADGSTGAPTGPGTDRSGTAVAAGGGKTLMAANAARRKLILKNDSTINMWYSLDIVPVVGPAAGMYKLPAGGGYFELDSYTGPVLVISESGTPPYSAREW